MLNLSAPWTTYYREMQALFKHDPEVHVLYNPEEPELKLLVDNANKAEVLGRVLPCTKKFGNVVLNISVVPADGKIATATDIEDFHVIFEGNDAVSYMWTVPSEMGLTFNYVVFKNEVVQFFNDNLMDPHGLCSTLYQNIAKDIFEDANNVFFATDTPSENDKVGMPLGEWP